MSFREKIKSALKEKREKLTDSSLKTYVSILSNLHKQMNATDDDLDWFNKQEREIFEHLKAQTRKSVLSALFILTGNDEYRKIMLDDCKVVNENYKSQKMSDKEKENWIEVKEIQDIHDNLLAKVKAMFSKNMMSDYQTIIDYFLIACLGGVSGILPRRSLDYALLKIRNYDTSNTSRDNYYKAGKFYFNTYKTSSKYGLQILDVPKELNTMIKKWIKLNDTDYLLFSSNKKPLSSPQISRMLNKIFGGKHISTDMLRHIYLTAYYKDIPKLKEMEKLSQDMGHSLNQQMLYAKKE